MRDEPVSEASISDRPKLRVAPRSGRKTGTLAALIIFALFAFFIWKNFRAVEVSGPSMLPTFHTGQRVTVSDAYWLFGQIRDGDIVVFKIPGDSSFIIKRVYKMAGEKVDYVNSPKGWSFTNGEFTVPPGTIFVLGDNRPKSDDSRVFGPVELSKVLGKVIVYR